MKREANEVMIISESVMTALSIANRVCGCVNAPSLFQLVAARCADETTDLSGYDGNRRLLYDGLTEAGFASGNEALNGEGLVAPGPGAVDDQEFHVLMLEGL